MKITRLRTFTLKPIVLVSTLLGLWTSPILAGVHIDACDAQWLSVRKFEALLSVEFAQHRELDKTLLDISITHCTKEKVTLRVTYQEFALETTLLLLDTPPENRIRTIVLASAELLVEIEHRIRAPKFETEENTNTPERTSSDDNQAIRTPTTARRMPMVYAVPAATSDKPTQKQLRTKRNAPQPPAAQQPLSDAPPKEDTPQKNASDKPLADLRLQRTRIYQFGGQINAILFAEQRTVAPELRLTLRVHRAILGYFLSARGWNDTLGSVVILGTGGFAGVQLWETKGKIDVGWDVVTDLGAVFSKGKATGDAGDSQQTNFAFGGRTQFWCRVGKARTRFAVNVGLGWLRGLKAWTSNRKLGGFHGLLLSMGAGLVW